MTIINVDVSVILGPLNPPKLPWYLTEREFGLYGGFRGVQARAEELRVIAVVLIEVVSVNMPRFRRPGSPFYRVMGFYVGNIDPADRGSVLRQIFEFADYDRTSDAIVRKVVLDPPIREITANVEVE